MAKKRSKSRRYSIQLTKGEIEALKFLSSRYHSARYFNDGLDPLDASAGHALFNNEFDHGSGPYRFQISSVDVRKTLRATAEDGGDYGMIPNLSSRAVHWVLIEEAQKD